MAKISFSKLGLKVNQEVKIVEWNGQNIEVKQYLPISDKLDLLSNVLNHCQDTDNNNFMNIAKMTMFLTIEILLYYTNINVTEKMKEEPAKLYDQIVSTGLMTAIKEQIDEQELTSLYNWCIETCEHLYTYRNSIYAIMDAMGNDYNNLQLDAEGIQEILKNPDNLEQLKPLLTKLD